MFKNNALYNYLVETYPRASKAYLSSRKKKKELHKIFIFSVKMNTAI